MTTNLARADAEGTQSHSPFSAELVTAANLGWLEWHSDVSRSKVSAQCWRLVGQAVDPLDSFQSWTECVAGVGVEIDWNRLGELFAEETSNPVTVQLEAAQADGTTSALQMTAQIIQLEKDGRPAVISAILSPSCQRCEFASASAESKGVVEKFAQGRRFQKLMMNTMEDLLFVKDEDFRIVEANDAFLRLYPEESRDKVIGSTTIEDYDEEQRNEFLAEDRRAFAEGVSETHETIYFPDGHQRQLWTKKIRFEDATGARFLLGYARDVTDIKQTERALRTANEELEEFAYRVSHDLRSPLQSSVHLLDYLGAALERGNLEEASTLHATVRSSLGNLDSLARDVLNVHRSRRGELRAERLDVEEAVEGILDRHKLDLKSLSATASYDISSPAIVDPYGLKLVMENLISNAVKYRDTDLAEPSVAVQVRADARYLRLSVVDNGLGIPEANRSKLFGMFQRFHPRKSFGSGLGLYMTQQWVERMGGTIEATHLEQGTRFDVRIPQGKSEAAFNSQGEAS